MSDLYDFESETDRMEEMYLDDEAGMALSEYVTETEYKIMIHSKRMLFEQKKSFMGSRDF